MLGLQRTPAVLCCLALAVLLAPATQLAAALGPEDLPYLGTFRPGLPPSLVGVWVEERPIEGQTGVVSVLTRTWLPDGNGFVTFARADTEDGASLVAGGFVRERLACLTFHVLFISHIGVAGHAARRGCWRLVLHALPAQF
ncbi:hypothetical protein ABPG75_003400 [Micractinium tetrahymenae]